MRPPRSWWSRSTPGNNGVLRVNTEAEITPQGVLTLTNASNVASFSQVLDNGGSAVLTNNGAISVETGASGGPRFLQIDTTNNGTLNVDHPTTLIGKTLTNTGAMVLTQPLVTSERGDHRQPVGDLGLLGGWSGAAGRGDLHPG